MKIFIKHKEVDFTAWYLNLPFGIHIYYDYLHAGIGYHIIFPRLFSLFIAKKGETFRGKGKYLLKIRGKQYFLFNKKR